jgi:hypothetical protein
MPLFNKFRRKPAIDAAGIEEIRSRVRAMRDQIGRRDIELADLFELVGEDDRMMLQMLAKSPRKTPPAQRVWPHEVPSSAPLAAETEPKVTYGDWELMRPPAKFTVP